MVVPSRLSSFNHEPPLVIDSSAIAELMRCARAFMFHKCNSLMMPGNSIHLIAGGAFAAGLEAYRRAHYFHKADHENAMIYAFLKAGEKWGKFGHDPEATKTKPFTSVIRALHAYVHHFPPRTDNLRPVFNRLSGEPSVEFSFALPLDDFPLHPTGDPFILAGRFDLLSKDQRDDTIKWVDEKTTYSFAGDTSDKWQLRWQFLTYTWALRRMGYEVDGGVVRAVGMLKTRTDFLEVPVTFPPHLLEEYELSLRFLLSMLRMYHKNEFYPALFGDACDWCSYKILCQNSRVENWKSLYVKDLWDPLKQRTIEDDGSEALALIADLSSELQQ